MPDENKIGVNSDLVPILPDENDDITEYLTDSSFESLKKRFAAAEEDQSIRDEDFNPLIAGKATKKAVEDGRITEKRINESVKKILTLKYEKIEENYNEYLPSSYLNSKEHQEILKKVK